MIPEEKLDPPKSCPPIIVAREQGSLISVGGTVLGGCVRCASICSRGGPTKGKQGTDRDPEQWKQRRPYQGYLQQGHRELAGWRTSSTTQLQSRGLEGPLQAFLKDVESRSRATSSAQI